MVAWTHQELTFSYYKSTSHWFCDHLLYYSVFHAIYSLDYPPGFGTLVFASLSDSELSQLLFHLCPRDLQVQRSYRWALILSFRKGINNFVSEEVEHNLLWLKDKNIRSRMQGHTIIPFHEQHQRDLLILFGGKSSHGGGRSEWKDLQAGGKDGCKGRRWLCIMEDLLL